MRNRGLEHHSAALEEEEMYLDVLRLLTPSELDANLMSLGLTLGARKKISKGLNAPALRE